LIQFVTKYFGRMRRTIKANHAEPLLFLDVQIAEAAIAATLGSLGNTPNLRSTDTDGR
jgi:hypothetical protein